MLVCPKCQFENPESHKFCQACGASLAAVQSQPERSPLPATAASPEASTFDPEEAEDIPEPASWEMESEFDPEETIWRALIFPTASTATADHASVPLSAPWDESIFTAGNFLDNDQRYQILKSWAHSQDSSTAAELQVVDCFPFQPTFIDKVQADLLETEDLDFATAQVPEFAKLYLNLQQQRYPVLPQIHDSWEQAGRTFVLIEERGELPPLLDRFGDSEVMTIQVLSWLHEMTELWAILQPQGCCQSLLQLDNLRTDEDHILCLQRLYLDSPQPEQAPQLKDLGKIWQLLFHHSQRTQFGSLALLCNDLSTGKIKNLDQLRSQLIEIVNQVKPLAPKTVMASEFSDCSGSPDSMPFRDESTQIVNPFTGSDIPPSAHLGEVNPDDADIDLSSISSGDRPPSPFDPEADLEADTQHPLQTDSIPQVVEDNGTTFDGDDSPTVVLPMKLMSLQESGLTDIGRQREHNEDSFSIQTAIRKSESPEGATLHAKGLYILCDGMGGHAGGEVASALAVDTLKKYFETHWQNQLPTQDSIREAIIQANQAIYDLNQKNARLGSGRMGTTLVMVLIQDTEVAIANVGDSRLYRFTRRGGLEQLTIDHEVGQREIQRGVEAAIAYARPDAYQLTQALGPRDQNFIDPDVTFLEVNEDSLFLLCSDGLTDNDLLEDYCETHVSPLLSSQAHLEQGTSKLIDLANQFNGHDNITVVAIRAKVRPNLENLRSNSFRSLR